MKDFALLETESTTDVIQEVDQEDVDRLICADIDNLTAENNQIWASPDNDRRENVHSFFQYPAMMVPIVKKNN